MSSRIKNQNPTTNKHERKKTADIQNKKRKINQRKYLQCIIIMNIKRKKKKEFFCHFHIVKQIRISAAGNGNRSNYHQLLIITILPHRTMEYFELKKSTPVKRNSFFFKRYFLGI